MQEIRRGNSRKIDNTFDVITDGFSIHNKFNIKVSRDGKTIREVETFNRVLDFGLTNIGGVAYAEPVNKHLHVGTGTSPTTDSMTRLETYNNLFGCSSYSVEYINRTTIAIVSGFTIPANTCVGVAISELGVSRSTSQGYLFNRTLITDTNGNVTPINKTDLDIIDIEVTIYVTIPLSETVKPVVSSKWNATNIQGFHYKSEGTLASGRDIIGTISLRPSVVTGTYGSTGYYRVSPTTCNDNYGVASVEVGGCMYYTPSSVTDYQVAVGDGSTTQFVFKDFIPCKNGELKVDGVLMDKSNYLFSANHDTQHEFTKCGFTEYIDCNKTAVMATGSIFETHTSWEETDDPDPNKAYKSSHIASQEYGSVANIRRFRIYKNNTTSTAYVLIEGSDDEDTWDTIIDTSFKESNAYLDVSTYVSGKTDVSYKSYRLTLFHRAPVRIGFNFYTGINNITGKDLIFLGDAPPSGSKITYTGPTATTPKSDQNVVDLNFTWLASRGE